MFRASETAHEQYLQRRHRFAPAPHHTHAAEQSNGCATALQEAAVWLLGRVVADQYKYAIT
jgi:hypothetical protein